MSALKKTSKNKKVWDKVIFVKNSDSEVFFFILHCAKSAVQNVTLVDIQRTDSKLYISL